MTAPNPTRGGGFFCRILVGLAVLQVAACGSMPVHDGVEVAILEGHRHSDYCGHYYYGFKWYFVKDHHHGEGCGHVFEYGRWTLE